jgi:hypothetical protein
VHSAHWTSFPMNRLNPQERITSITCLIWASIRSRPKIRHARAVRSMSPRTRKSSNRPSRYVEVTIAWRALPDVHWKRTLKFLLLTQSVSSHS